ncbi:MAG: T9SS type A sorting domain-containing protein [Flavobacteriales bacterium]|nr:T9SS type A sorting domain-containing protein [Flavobacteriales bacterium]
MASGLSDDVQVEVFDLLGQSVYHGKTRHGRLRIDTGTWSSGIYLVHAGNQAKRWVKR